MKLNGKKNCSLLTIAQVAEMLACSPATVYALVDGGQLPVVSIGKSKGYRVDPNDLETFVAERKFTFRKSEELGVPQPLPTTGFKHLRNE